MAFEENDAPNATPSPASNADIGTLPTNAPAAPRPVSPAPTSAPASRPAAPVTPPQAQEQPEAPGSHFKNLSHSLKGAVLAVLAGPQQVVDHYETDDSGKPMKAVMRHLHPNERLQLMAQAALTGLAAGSRVPPQKSKMAGFAAGIGAGADAEMQQAQGADLLKRQQSQEDYDRKQKEQVHKATIAMTNATTHSTWQKIGDDENAKDTVRQTNMGIVNSLNDYVAQNPQSKLTVQTLTEDQALAMREADAHTVAKHTFLPVGRVQAKDQNGNDVFEADGVTPKFVKQFAAISGSADEKMPLPQGMLDDVKKYSKFDPRLKSFADVPVGTMVPLTGFLTAYKYATEDKGKEADAWKDPEGKNSVSVDGKIMQHNPYTTETREYPGGVPLGAQKEQAEIKLKGAEAFEKTELGNKAKKDADTEALFNPPASSGLNGDEYLKTLPQDQQNVLKAFAEGRETRSPRQLQDKNGNPTPLANALHRAYPDFDDKKAAAYGAVVKDFTSGPTSRSLTAYGTAINHARALYDNTNLKSYIPGTDENKRYNQDITYVATEVAKALNPTGQATESAIKEQEEALRSYTNRKAAIENAEHILTGKMAETKQRWANAQVRPSYQPPMPGLSPEAIANADYVRNHGKVSQPSSQPQGGQNFPPGATHIVPGPDGKNHYTNADGTKDYGVAQ